MATKIYVGNLAYSMTDDQLRETFSEFGEVVSASVIIDKNSGRSRGFGFVEMATEEEASAAISELNDKEFDGRRLVVNEARPREDRSGSRRERF